MTAIGDFGLLGYKVDKVMKLSFLISAFAFVFLCGCAPLSDQRMVSLGYEDFGPQVIAHELIGNEWWQWWSHGDSRPRDYDVKVIVYRSISLDEVKERYPVDEEGQRDYRYVAYRDAIVYLERHIDEDVLPSVTAKLLRTKDLLQERLD